MSKRSDKLQFDSETIRRIYERDGGCIWCIGGYTTESPPYIFDPVHVVNKSQGGLGVIENGVCGCREHHHICDNDNRGRGNEMREFAERYLINIYKGWTKESVTYQKYQ